MASSLSNLSVTGAIFMYGVGPCEVAMVAFPFGSAYFACLLPVLPIADTHLPIPFAHRQVNTSSHQCVSF